MQFLQIYKCIQQAGSSPRLSKVTFKEQDELQYLITSIDELR